MVMSGADIVTVSRLLGHATIQMTMRYAKISRDHARKSIGVLDSIIPPSEPIFKKEEKISEDILALEKETKVLLSEILE